MVNWDTGNVEMQFVKTCIISIMFSALFAIIPALVIKFDKVDRTLKSVDVGSNQALGKMWNIMTVCCEISLALLRGA